MKIRKAIISDFEELLRLNKELFDFEEQFGHKYNLEWTYSDVGKNYFKGRLENERSIFYVAEENELLIGYILGYISNLPYRRINPICEIENMFVEEKYRGSGIGSDLIKRVREDAINQSVKVLRVGTISQNDPAISFYKKNKFTEVNTFLEEEIVS
jgi:ribosomal protein S18 acetylase RimI-like enzyme